MPYKLTLFDMDDTVLAVKQADLKPELYEALDKLLAVTKATKWQLDFMPTKADETLITELIEAEHSRQATMELDDWRI